MPSSFTLTKRLFSYLRKVTLRLRFSNLETKEVEGVHVNLVHALGKSAQVKLSTPRTGSEESAIRHMHQMY